MTKFRNTGVNMSELYVFCLEVNRISKRDVYLAANDTIYLQGSKLMNLFVNKMKIKIDDDINNIPEDKSSYTPKMLIISGHDNTLCIQELFLIMAFDLDINLFKYPTFSSQITFEITTNDDKKENKKYSDYFVNYYLNDDLILNKTAEEFLKK